jgi:hypothetical protein
LAGRSFPLAAEEMKGFKETLTGRSISGDGFQSLPVSQMTELIFEKVLYSVSR